MKSKNVIKALSKNFPKLKEIIDFDEGPYSILGNLAIYLNDSIANNSLQESEKEMVFQFLNEMGNSDDIETKNLLVVGVLEILTDYPKTIEAARMYLKDEALVLFEKTLTGWSESAREQ